MNSVSLGTGLAFWGDNLRPAVEMVQRAEIDYLCCDHLAELTMSILSKQRSRDENRGYTTDVVPLLRSVLPTCREKEIKVISNAGGANPSACARRIVGLCQELGLPGTKVAVVTGDDVMGRIDEFMGAGVEFANMDTGEPLSTVRQRLTHANVYTGAGGIVEALEQCADVVICGRVTDMALYMGPMRHALGWKADDWDRLGPGAGAAHCAECGGQATGGLFAGGWSEMERLEDIGYPVTRVYQNGEAILSKTPHSGGAVTVATVSEQLVYEVLDPGNYLTADVTADLTGITLEQVGSDQVRMAGIKGKPAPDTLKVNMGYRAGFVGEAQFTYTWPDAYKKARAGVELLERRLARVDFHADEVRIEYLGHNSMWGPGLIAEPDDPDLIEIVVRYAARCPTEEQARKVYTESVPLYNNGPAGLSGIGTRPAIKELYGLWPCLMPRELISERVDLVEA